MLHACELSYLRRQVRELVGMQVQAGEAGDVTHTGLQFTQLVL